MLHTECNDSTNDLSQYITQLLLEIIRDVIKDTQASQKVPGTVSLLIIEELI